MSNPFRTRLPLFTLALGLTASGCLANAQTAPQLLPYTTKVVAGGGTSTPASGAKCSVSGYTATDAYGDGCLATEVLLGTAANTPGPRDAIADSLGNIFFGDYVNGVVHRIDAVTGILSDVAGGAATSPSSGACGLGVATDSRGDGCTSTFVHLSHPTGLVFGPNGDLYIADYGYGEVRKVANTGGFIPAGGGIISLVAGSLTTTGFNVSNSTTTVTAAQSILDGPYSLSFDTQGDLYIADEYEAAVVVLNTNTATSTMVAASPTSNPISIAPGTIWKIAGTLSTGGPYCGSSGCTYNHVYTDGIQANTDYLRNAYGVTVDPSGNVFITNEYYDTIQKVATTGILTTYAGTNNAPGHALTRGTAGTVAIGSPFGVISDALGNIYFDDAADGVIWRVDAGTLSQYVIAQGFGFSGTGFATTTLPGPGIFGLSVDPYADLFYGDTENNVVGEVASGSQFGPIGANQPTNTLDIHFAKGDTPANSAAYTITTGANNFTTTGVATCTVNSDMTEDCLLPVTATPTTLGRFTGTLTVKSSLGATAAIPLSGYFIQSPVTRTSVTYTTTATCTGTTTFSTTTPITLTATLAANGPNPPGGSFTFYANNGVTNTAIGSPVNVTNLGTTASPVYGATLTYTFATIGTYTITAVYSGDSYFNTSTGKLANTITTSAPGLTVAMTPGYTSQNVVSAGQTGLYSFNVAQNVYTGTISFSCSGLPANSSCVFSPPSINATGCSVTTTVALSIVTQTTTVTPAGIGLGRTGKGQILAMLAGLALALMVGLRRRHGIRFAQIWMSLALLLTLSGALACGSATTTGARTPSGTYNNIVVTINGSAGGSTTLPPLTLKVN